MTQDRLIQLLVPLTLVCPLTAGCITAKELGDAGSDADDTPELTSTGAELGSSSASSGMPPSSTAGTETGAETESVAETGAPMELPAECPAPKPETFWCLEDRGFSTSVSRTFFDSATNEAMTAPRVVDLRCTVTDTNEGPGSVDMTLECPPSMPLIPGGATGQLTAEGVPEAPTLPLRVEEEVLVSWVGLSPEGQGSTVVRSVDGRLRIADIRSMAELDLLDTSPYVVTLEPDRCAPEQRRIDCAQDEFMFVQRVGIGFNNGPYDDPPEPVMFTGGYGTSSASGQGTFALNVALANEILCHSLGCDGAGAPSIDGVHFSLLAVRD